MSAAAEVIRHPTSEAKTAGAAPELGFRPALALREFTRGNLTLGAATEIAQMTEDDFIGLIGRSDLAALKSDTGLAPVESPSPIQVSVVIPLHNEESTISALHARLAPVVSTFEGHEILFVDDGSTDRSVQAVLELQGHDENVKLVRLSRNFGKEAALAAGLQYARGRAVVVMDADLQDPPEVLLEMVQRWEEGHEVVYAVRRKRKETLWKRAGYHAFYRLMRLVADIQMPLDAGDFCLMDRRVVEAVSQLPERNRFMRGLRSWAGFRQIGVEYERPERYAGEPKFTFRKLVKTAVDGMMAFTSLPLRVATYVGFLTATAGLVFLAVAIYSRLFTPTPDGWTSLVAVVLTLGGTQLMVTGVLGAYVARIYDETKQRPAYIVEGLYDRRGVTRG